MQVDRADRTRPIATPRTAPATIELARALATADRRLRRLALQRRGTLAATVAFGLTLVPLVIDASNWLAAPDRAAWRITLAIVWTAALLGVMLPLAVRPRGGRTPLALADALDHAGPFTGRPVRMAVEIAGMAKAVGGSQDRTPSFQHAEPDGHLARSLRSRAIGQGVVAIQHTLRDRDALAALPPGRGSRSVAFLARFAEVALVVMAVAVFATALASPRRVLLPVARVVDPWGDHPPVAPLDLEIAVRTAAQPARAIEFLGGGGPTGSDVVLRPDIIFAGDALEVEVRASGPTAALAELAGIALIPLRFGSQPTPASASHGRGRLAHSAPPDLWPSLIHTPTAIRLDRIDRDEGGEDGVQRFRGLIEWPTAMPLDLLAIAVARDAHGQLRAVARSRRSAVDLRDGPRILHALARLDRTPPSPEEPLPVVRTIPGEADRASAGDPGHSPPRVPFGLVATGQDDGAMVELTLAPAAADLVAEVTRAGPESGRETIEFRSDPSRAPITVAIEHADSGATARSLPGTARVKARIEIGFHSAPPADGEPHALKPAAVHRLSLRARTPDGLISTDEVALTVVTLRSDAPDAPLRAVILPAEALDDAILIAGGALPPGASPWAEVLVPLMGPAAASDTARPDRATARDATTIATAAADSSRADGHTGQQASSATAAANGSGTGTDAGTGPGSGTDAIPADGGSSAGTRAAPDDTAPASVEPAAVLRGGQRIHRADGTPADESTSTDEPLPAGFSRAGDRREVVQAAPNRSIDESAATDPTATTEEEPGLAMWAGATPDERSLVRAWMRILARPVGPLRTTPGAERVEASGTGDTGLPTNGEVAEPATAPSAGDGP